uniref:Uncharacterized protein n=1 Tax=Fusarium oxysporum (strain Fo5176) TaxID=660025 RepID=A0A0D2X8U3_FUSOF
MRTPGLFEFSSMVPSQAVSVTAREPPRTTCRAVQMTSCFCTSLSSPLSNSTLSSSLPSLPRTTKT